MSKSPVEFRVHQESNKHRRSFRSRLWVGVEGARSRASMRWERLQERQSKLQKQPERQVGRESEDRAKRGVGALMTRISI